MGGDGKNMRHFYYHDSAVYYAAEESDLRAMPMFSVLRPNGNDFYYHLITTQTQEELESGTFTPGFTAHVIGGVTLQIVPANNVPATIYGPGGWLRYDSLRTWDLEDLDKFVSEGTLLKWDAEDEEQR